MNTHRLKWKLLKQKAIETSGHSSNHIETYLYQIFTSVIFTRCFYSPLFVRSLERSQKVVGSLSKLLRGDKQRLAVLYMYFVFVHPKIVEENALLIIRVSRVPTNLKTVPLSLEALRCNRQFHVSVELCTLSFCRFLKNRIYNSLSYDLVSKTS